MEIELKREKLHFKIPARTSRGEYTEHEMLIVKLSNDGRCGIGECAPLPDLSCDRNAYSDINQVSSMLKELLKEYDGQMSEPSFASKEKYNNIIGPGTIGANHTDKYHVLKTRINKELRNYPALLFAVESALAELTHDRTLYETDFAKGKEGIPINGLVWMADHDTMLKQMEEKIAQGYRCIKLKIGAINWEDEMSLIKSIRSRFTENELQLRVDANGAFSSKEAKEKLNELSQWKIHSIEQPIRQGQWEMMAELCRTSPVPVALDEELIGINEPKEKERMLDALKPQYIVVKPTLHGGISGSREWIEMADKRGIKSWITSALESNIGLRNVALLAASIYTGNKKQIYNGEPADMNKDIQPAFSHRWELPQGLGTGLLFTDNFETGVHIKDGHIWIS